MTPKDGAIHVNAIEESTAVKDLLARLKKRLNNLTPAMEVIGETVQASILLNFEKGGRPKSWAPLSQMTKDRRKKEGTWPGKILQRTGALSRIFYKAGPDSVAMAANEVYAAVQHFGAKKGEFGTITATIKAHIRTLKSGKTVKVPGHTRKMAIPWGDIPARPFMLVQEKDWDDITDQLADFLLALRPQRG